MMPRFTPFLIIATLLMCPYGCLAAAVCDQSDETAVRSCCAGCCQKSLPEGDSEPAPDDRSGISCLCEGALLEIGEVNLAALLVESSSEPMLPSAVSPRGDLAASYQLKHDRLHVDGGELRIALQSFLC